MPLFAEVKAYVQKFAMGMVKFAAME